MTKETADVAVIGAGIVGMSAAYQLARHSAGRIVVLEKGTAVGQGSTGASSACLRVRYSHTEVMQLALAGLETYGRWRDFTGLSQPRASVERTGVLWMLGEDQTELAAERDRLRSVGAAAEILDAAALSDRFPLLSPCHSALDFKGEQEHECAQHNTFLFEPEGGYCTDPVGANQDLLEACQREGVDVRFRAGLADVRTKAGRAVGVTLDDGSEIDVPTIVNAAGPWCNRVNAMAGIETRWSLRPTRVQVLLRAKTGGIKGTLPMVADAIGGIYFRPESNGQQILVGSIRPEDEQERVDDPDALRPGVDEQARLRLLHGLHHRIPGLAHQGRVTSVVGMYTMNEQDVHPVVGPTDLQGYYVANGFSGHGFKLAPAIGSMIAQLLTGTRLEGDTDVSPAFLSIHRDSLAVREMSVLA